MSKSLTGQGFWTIFFSNFVLFLVAICRYMWYNIPVWRWHILYLNKYTNKETGRVFLSIVHKYRDPNNPKSIKSKTVMKVGYLDVLEKEYDDPIAHFTQLAKEMDAKRLADEADFIINIPKSAALELGKDLEKNFGYAVLSKIYHELRIDEFITNRQKVTNEEYDANTIMKMLVYSRILYPDSKKSSFEGRNRFFEKTNYSLDDVYRFLSFLSARDDEFLVWLNDQVTANYGRDNSVVFYDVTNYYFESDEPDELRVKGCSKEHRPNPIVQMGLFMDKNGLPITFELFPGNTNDCLTYRPNFKTLKTKFNFSRVITVADKAMCTGDNIYYTTRTPDKDGYVFSMSVHGASKEMKDFVLSEEGYRSYGEDDSFKIKSRLEPRIIDVSTKSGKKMKVEVDEKQVSFYSRKYAERAKAQRDAVLQKANDLIKNPGKYTRATSHGAAKYVNNLKFDEQGTIIETKSALSIKEDLVKEEEKYDGYYILVSSEMDKADTEILDIYRGLWKIEESFRITKSELEARPVYVWTKEHIKAHFMTCFASLLILRILELKTNRKFSVDCMIEAMRSSTCILADQNVYLFHYYDRCLKALGDATGIDFSAKALTLKDIKKIIADTKKK